MNASQLLLGLCYWLQWTRTGDLVEQAPFDKAQRCSGRPGVEL